MAEIESKSVEAFRLQLINMGYDRAGFASDAVIESKMRRVCDSINAGALGLAGAMGIAVKRFNEQLARLEIQK